jgi:TPR repeat protein
MQPQLVEILAALAMAALLVGPAAGDYRAGKAAYQRGDYATALGEWLPLAQRGDASAQYNLGVMHAEGRGVPRDDAAAVRWYRKAADQGDVDAQRSLGLMYATGRGVPRDDVEAWRWLRKANRPN